MTWRATAATLPLGLPEITPAQVRGIEINAYAYRRSDASRWLIRVSRTTPDEHRLVGGYMEGTWESIVPDEQQNIGRPIVVGENMYVCWDSDHDRTQKHFLDSLDPAYFAYMCEVHEDRLDSDQDQHAAVALRVTYSHILESLFALVGAATQAPKCPAGWMLRYQTSQLTALIEKITERKMVLNQLRLTTRGWPEVARALTPVADPSSEVAEHVLATGNALGALARDFINGDFEREYNSLKHGLRVRSGGSYFAIGTEDTPGVPAPVERMRMIAQSDFGSTFLIAQKLKARQFASGHTSLNWVPHAFAKRIPLAVTCMENVIECLKVMNGVTDGECRLALLTEEIVGRALSSPSRSFRFTLNASIAAEEVPDLSADEILSKYNPDMDAAMGASDAK